MASLSGRALAQDITLAIPQAYVRVSKRDILGPITISKDLTKNSQAAKLTHMQRSGANNVLMFPITARETVSKIRMES